MWKRLPAPPAVKFEGLFDPSALLTEPRSDNEFKIRRLCDNAYLGDHISLCRVLGRYKMFVDTRDVGLSSHLLLDGYWEMWITEAMVQLIRPGMIVADIGANLGYFTLLMSELVGPNGRVHAFEPNPEMTIRLQRSIDVNGFTSRAHLHDVLLGNADGDQMLFVVPENEPKNGHMYPFPGYLPQGATLLKTCRLDSRSDWQEIELAKIDVEGAEELVWAGAAGLLSGSRLRTVILEFTPGRYSDPAAFLERILEWGFGLEVISPYTGICRATRADVLESDPTIDIMLLLRR